MIVVVLRKREKLDLEDLFKYCDRNMPSFMVPRCIRYIRFTSALPGTPNDKARKVEFRAAGVTAGTWHSDAAGLKPTWDRARGALDRTAVLPYRRTSAERYQARAQDSITPKHGEMCRTRFLSAI